jgi:hypothetical protein
MISERIASLLLFTAGLSGATLAEEPPSANAAGATE